MKTKHIKAIAVILTIISVLASFNALAFAKEANSGQCGDNAYWSFDSKTGNMTISGKGEMWDFRNDADFYNYHECSYKDLKASIKSVTFSDEITYIGADAFSGCGNLKTFNWGKSIAKIGNFAFLATGLESVIMPDSVTYVGQQAFSMCEELKTAKLPDNAYFIDAGIFDFDDKLVEVDFGKAAPSICGDGTIGRCKSLKTIKVDPENKQFHLQNGVLFYYEILWQYPAAKTGLTYVIPDGTDTITDMAFGSAQNLCSVFIPTSVTKMKTYPFLISNIKELYYGGSREEWEKINFSVSEIEIIENGDDYEIAFGLFGTYKIHFNATVEQMEEETKYNYVHEYESTTIKATPDKNGSITKVCTFCGEKTKTAIYRPADFKLSFSTVVYTGKALKPTVTVKNSKGKTISSKYYTVSYKNNTNVGKATVTITFKGNYSGTKALSFTIAPKQVTGLKVSSVKTTSITLKWSKVTGAKYYKLEKSTDGKKWTTVTTTDKTTYTVKSLKAGTKYQFRVTALDSTKKISGKSSAVLKTATLTGVPSVTLKPSKSKTATASWKKVTGASKYVVYKSTDGKKWTKVTTTTKLAYTFTKLTGGRKIYVKVTALNAYGKASAYSSAKSVIVRK